MTDDLQHYMEATSRLSGRVRELEDALLPVYEILSSYHEQLEPPHEAADGCSVCVALDRARDLVAPAPALSPTSGTA